MGLAPGCDSDRCKLELRIRPRGLESLYRINILILHAVDPSLNLGIVQGPLNTTTGHSRALSEE